MTEKNEHDEADRRETPGGNGAETGREERDGAAAEPERESESEREPGPGPEPGPTPPVDAARGGGEHGRRGRRIAVTALILVLLLAVLTALGGYWLWRQLGMIGASQVQQAEAMTQRLDRLTGRVDALRDSGVDRAQTLGRLQARVEQLRSDQQALLQRIERVAGRAEATKQDWRRSEAAYLASVAVHRLRFYGDVDAALGALKTADALLAGYGGESIKARKAIREAIDRLIAADVPDTAAIASRLGGLIGKLGTLPLAPRPPERVAGDGSTAAGSGDNAGGWRARLARAWQQFRSGLSELVVVSREREVVPLTTPEQRYFLRQNLRLELEAARLAALEGNAELYRDSIERALGWAKRYLDPEQPAVAEFISSLEALRGKQVSADLPEIASVLEPVRQL